ncbi:MAG: hypothetical protein ACI4B5_09290 [Bacteroidaceae bacterium]
MNIYLRYFNKETLVSSVKDAIEFLQGIPDIDMDEFLVQDITNFVEGSNMYPKRYKVRGHSYFIVIKTMATTMEDFKNKGAATRLATENARVQREERQAFFSSKKEGWYEGKLLFKRVIAIPQTQKFQYMDTTFVARVHTDSVQECYNAIVNHLRTRNDVDPRSQFPSIKGRNFECRYLGE